MDLALTPGTRWRGQAGGKGTRWWLCSTLSWNYKPQKALRQGALAPLTSGTETIVAWQQQARGVAAAGGKTALVSSLPKCFEEGVANRAGK